MAHPMSRRHTKRHLETKMPRLCWDTRIRTRNDRTRICSVTITPYPNIPPPFKLPLTGVLRVQRYAFFLNHQYFVRLFYKKTQNNLPLPLFYNKSVYLCITNNTLSRHDGYDRNLRQAGQYFELRTIYSLNGTSKKIS